MTSSSSETPLQAPATTRALAPATTPAAAPAAAPAASAQAHSSFLYRCRVAFHHTDAAGIVHFARYFLFAEEAETECLRHLGLPGPREGMQYPRAAASAEYRRPLHFGDEVIVRTSLTRIGKSSLHWHFLVKGPEGPCAELRCISARRDKEGKAAPYTEAEKRLLSSLCTSADGSETSN